MDSNESDGSDNGFEERQNQNHGDERDRGSAGDPGGDGGGGSGPGGGEGYDDDDDEDDDDDDEDNNDSISTGGASDEEHPYDISIAATHSYLGPGLVCTGGRAVLEAGWRGRVPAVAHHGVVFPGETVPMLLPHAPDAALLVQAIRHDKLFGLLCPDDSGTMLSGYGVLCEVMMAGIEEAAEAPTSVAFKARAIHRFRLVGVPRDTVPIQIYNRMRFVEVMVLPETAARDALRGVRLASLDPLRTSDRLSAVQRRLRALDAAATPWPHFVYDIFDLDSMKRTIREYFASLSLAERLPDDAVSLSFWVASNLPLTPVNRLGLFVIDNALLRLQTECLLISKKTILCCMSCFTTIARQQHIFAMSSEGVHSNYTNLGGYMHDIVTVSQARNVELSGAPSSEFSWFPGYAWSVALCANCMAHVGWRFEALKRNLRPYKFFGLCRNYVQPREPSEVRELFEPYDPHEPYEPYVRLAPHARHAPHEPHEPHEPHAPHEPHEPHDPQRLY